MPSREELSKIMKSANYGAAFTRAVEDQEASCFLPAPDGNVVIDRSCLKGALGNRRTPGSVGAKMAASWGSK
jgi:hypothetical protein